MGGCCALQGTQREKEGMGTPTRANRIAQPEAAIIKEPQHSPKIQGSNDIHEKSENLPPHFFSPQLVDLGHIFLLIILCDNVNMQHRDICFYRAYIISALLCLNAGYCKNVQHVVLWSHQSYSRNMLYLKKEKEKKNYIFF